ncbi:MAG: hypothetical protein K2M68_01780 [Muribaculaceae bacterium]|nr:hypothetical protein [Muribaculaceae bacterium]
MLRFVVSILILCLLPLSASAVSDQDSSVVDEPQGYAYDQTTFSNQREILDFIKTLDFDKRPPLKKLSDFYNDEKKLPDDKVLQKGIDLYQKGKDKKAVDYFLNVYMNKKCTPFEKNYAGWQVIHYIYFGELDIHFNGRPSRMDRTNMIGDICYDTKVSIHVGPSYLFLASDPKLSTYNPYTVIKSLVRGDFANSSANILCSNQQFTREFLAAVLYEAFPKNDKLSMSPFSGGNIMYESNPLRYYVTETSSSVSRANDCVERISEFFNLMDCVHLINRTKTKLNDKYGFGLTADELYKKAKMLNPNKEMNLINYNDRVKNISDKDELCQLLLLRSAYYGHPDAIVELLPYIVENVQIAHGLYIPNSKYWQKWIKQDVYEAYIYINYKIIDDIELILDGLSKIP